MTNFFVFKLNIQPHILYDYKSDKDFKYLKESLIPTMLDNIIGIKKSNVENIIELIPNETDDEEFKGLFTKLEEKTEKLLKLYKEIMEEFVSKQEIHYSKEFLQSNERCMEQRIKFEKSYPIVRDGYKLFSDELVEKEFEIRFDNKIGTGITHLKKFYKIKLFLRDHKDLLLNPLNLKAYYQTSEERIFVESQSETDALAYVLALEIAVNRNKLIGEKIGKININPLYDYISLAEEEYSEISFVIVYPNGNPSIDRHNLLKNTKAKEVHQKFVGPDGQPLKTTNLEEYVNEQGGKGYLKSFFAKGFKNSAKIVRKIKRVDSL